MKRIGPVDPLIRRLCRHLLPQGEKGNLDLPCIKSSPCPTTANSQPFAAIACGPRQSRRGGAARAGRLGSFRIRSWRRSPSPNLDCDAFYASVEKRDRPELRDNPVIVGGGVRGVVTTCCYIARISGVRSAMPMFKALKLCPEAVVIKPNFPKYVAESKRIFEKLRALTPLVQTLSLDEAWTDLGGTERLHGAPPAVILARSPSRDRARDRAAGLHRTGRQQVPGQDRLRPRQAPRLRGDRRGGGRGLPRDSSRGPSCRAWRPRLRQVAREAAGFAPSATLRARSPGIWRRGSAPPG